MATGSAAGLTLVECMLAVFMLSITAAGIMLSTAAGFGSIEYADTRIRAVRIAEQLLEETVVSPYTVGDPDRWGWGLDDYGGFTEDAGAIMDVFGSLNDPSDQAFRRTVTVTPATITLPELGVLSVDGKIIEVAVTSHEGLEWRVVRFIPEPSAP